MLHKWFVALLALALGAMVLPATAAPLSTGMNFYVDTASPPGLAPPASAPAQAQLLNMDHANSYQVKVAGPAPSASTRSSSTVRANAAPLERKAPPHPLTL